jgi:hypothetical protein
MIFKPSIHFSLVIAALIVFGINNLHANELDSPPECSKNADSCRVFAFVTASEASLRTHENQITVSCPMYFYSPPAETIEPECVDLVNAAVVLVNRRLSDNLSPIIASDIKYESGGGCYDTFIPGREQADCFTEISAIITLVWLPQKK